MRRVYDPKSPAEIVTLTFDFAGDLVAGETLTGTPVIAISVDDGADATPGNVLNGAAQLTAGEVLQSVTGGVNYAAYLITALADTSAGRKLELAYRLAIRPAYTH